MTLHGKRIRNFNKHFGYLKDGDTVVFGVHDVSRFTTALAKAGFPVPASINDAVLPDIRCGPVCRYNAEGRWNIRRDLPKETAYRQIEWTWKEWHGKDQVEKSDTKDVPYERYPRDFVPPPSVELRIAQGADGELVVIAAAQKVNHTYPATQMHTVNVFLEIFGECQAFTEDMSAIIRAPMRRLNWVVLPPGERPWKQLRAEIAPLLNRLTENKQKVVSRRFETINHFKPDFVATGHAGFSGYVVFGFTDRNLYLCESMYTGNATYVFEDDWRTLSQMTKAEILNQSLQKERVIHRAGWPTKINTLLR